MLHLERGNGSIGPDGPQHRVGTFVLVLISSLVSEMVLAVVKAPTFCQIADTAVAVLAMLLVVAEVLCWMRIARR